MARIRTVKPEFWTSEQITSCSPLARLLFIGLWTFADDGGVHPASVRRLRLEVFPADDIDDEQTATLMRELIDAGLVTEFDVDSQNYWHVTGWSKHQRIDKPTYRHPFPQNSTSPRRALAEHSTSPPRVVDEPSPTDRNGLERIGLEGNGSGKDMEGKKKQSKLRFESIDEDLTREMIDHIRKLDPSFKDPNVEKWANDFRLLRGDGEDRTPEAVRELMTWTYADPFWRSNVLSPSKLREKWTQLSIQMKGRTNGNMQSSRLGKRDGMYRSDAVESHDL